MTPLGLNTAAAPEAAALLPLAQATPSAAAQSAPDGAASASPTFGDLLAASFGQPETPANVVGSDAPAQKGASIAETWFATLNIDFGALGASLEAEENAASSAVEDAIASPLDDAEALTCSGDVDDEAVAALMACAVPVPIPVLISDPPQSVPDVPSIACDASPAAAALADAPVAQASFIQSSEPEEIPLSNTDKANLEHLRGNREATTSAAQSVPEPAASLAGKTASVSAAATPVHMTGQDDQLPALDDGRAAAQAVDAVELTAGRPGAKSAPAVAAMRAPEQQPDAMLSDSPASALENPLAVGQQQPGQVIEGAPAVQQNERTRETIAARLEMQAVGQSISSAPATAQSASQEGDEQEQSHTQDGSAQEALAVGLQENVVAARSGDGGAPATVFTVTSPIASAAAPASVHAPEMPQASAFTSVPDPQNVSRMIESMRVQIKDGIQEATVHLKPEHLGEVTISVRVERGLVSAIVHTETPAVQQWLEAQEGKLRSGLSEQGLHLERFYVHRDGSQERREQPRQQTNTARYRQQRDDSAIRFEVVV